MCLRVIDSHHVPSPLLSVSLLCLCSFSPCSVCLRLVALSMVSPPRPDHDPLPTQCCAASRRWTAACLGRLSCSSCQHYAPCIQFNFPSLQSLTRRHLQGTTAHTPAFPIHSAVSHLQGLPPIRLRFLLTQRYHICTYRYDQTRVTLQLLEDESGPIAGSYCACIHINTTSFPINSA